MSCWIALITGNIPVNGSVISVSIIYKTENMCHTYQLKYHVQQLISHCFFPGPHAKPHGVRGLSKHYYLQLYPKLGHGKYSIKRIPCSCIAFTTMLNNQRDYKVDSNKQPRY